MTATRWFSDLFGFEEVSYDATQAMLKADGEHLHVLTDPPRRIRMGRLEMPSLAELRVLTGAASEELASVAGALSDTSQEAMHREVVPSNTLKPAHIRVSNIAADARDLHLLPEASGALIQMASQFNLLEMPGPNVTPEAGITDYVFDRTQGPACAIAAAGATLYRNYLVQVGEGSDGVGQRAHEQVNMLADLEAAIGELHGITGIRMKNGYAMLDESTVKTIGEKLSAHDPSVLDDLRATLRIGVHWQAGVTLADAPENQTVTHALCSALPVAYNRSPIDIWEPFARLVLEASYEATLRAAVLNYRKTGNARVYLTFVGGGVFGNRREWILDAMERAVLAVAEYPLEVFWVSYGSVLSDVQSRVTRIQAMLGHY